MNRKKKIIIISAASVFIVSQLVYLLTLSPTVNFIDSGELITVCYKLGIAHPTGYPLYTLLGRLFSFFSFGTGALVINYMSSFFASLCGVAVFFIVLLLLLEKKRYTAVHERMLIPSAVAGLLTCFSLTLWQQAVIAEVYSLTACIYALLIVLLFRWYYGRRNLRLLFLFFFLLGIGFGNHLSLIHLVPAAVLLLIVAKEIKKKLILPGIILFITGVSLYLYLPVRSSLDPVMDWGNPDNIQRIINHVSGKQYRVWMFSTSGEILKEHLLNYIKLLSKQFSLCLLSLGLAGFIGMALKRNFKLLLFLCVIFVSDIAYSINYDIPDIDPYFIPSFIVVSIFSGAGLYAVLELGFIVRAKLLRKTLNYAFIFIVLVPVFLNRYYADNGSNYLAEQLGKDVLNVEPNSLVILKIWDYYSTSRYFQEIRNIRKDVTLIDQMLLMRSWYVSDIMRRHEILKNSKREVELFLEQVKPFEEGTSYNGNVIQLHFENMINSFIDNNIDKRAVYLSNDEETKIAPGYFKVPGKILFRISKKDTLYETNDDYEKILNDDSYRDERTRALMSRYPLLLLKRALHYQRKGLLTKAENAYKTLLLFDEEDANSLFHYANFLVQIKRYEEACDILNRIDTKTINNPRIMMLRKIIEDNLKAIK